MKFEGEYLNRKRNGKEKNIMNMVYLNLKGKEMEKEKNIIMMMNQNLKDNI